MNIPDVLSHRKVPIIKVSSLLSLNLKIFVSELCPRNPVGKQVPSNEIADTKYSILPLSLSQSPNCIISVDLNIPHRKGIFDFATFALLNFLPYTLQSVPHFDFYPA